MTRTLDIIFVGLACFDKQGSGYRVLFPDGRVPGPFDVPVHKLSVWVRPQSQHPNVQWSWPHTQTEFSVEDESVLTITGLKSSTPDDAAILGRLPNLKDSDSALTLATTPEAIMEVTVDRGLLSAHKHGTDGMIVVKWRVETEDRATVRFMFGQNWIDVTPNTEQVILANVGSGNPGADSDFNIYRKLATVKTGKIAPKKPVNDPLPEIPVQDPAWIHLRCPFIDCSPAFAK